MTVILLMAHYRGRVGGRVGYIVRGRFCPPFDLNTDSSVVSSESDRKRLNLQDRSRQCLKQFGTTHILINAIDMPNRPCNVPWCFDRVGNKSSVENKLGHL